VLIVIEIQLFPQLVISMSIVIFVHLFSINHNLYNYQILKTFLNMSYILSKTILFIYSANYIYILLL